ncbi:MAG: hypothetical protein AAGG07_08300 [Planctomycetota bacterium]
MRAFTLAILVGSLALGSAGDTTQAKAGESPVQELAFGADAGVVTATLRSGVVVRVLRVEATGDAPLTSVTAAIGYGPVHERDGDLGVSALAAIALERDLQSEIGRRGLADRCVLWLGTTSRRVLVSIRAPARDLTEVLAALASAMSSASLTSDDLVELALRSEEAASVSTRSLDGAVYRGAARSVYPPLMRREQRIRATREVGESPVMRAARAAVRVRAVLDDAPLEFGIVTPADWADAVEATAASFGDRPEDDEGMVPLRPARSFAQPPETVTYEWNGGARGSRAAVVAAPVSIDRSLRSVRAAFVAARALEVAARRAHGSARAGVLFDPGYPSSGAVWLRLPLDPEGAGLGSGNGTRVAAMALFESLTLRDGSDGITDADIAEGRAATVESMRRQLEGGWWLPARLATLGALSDDAAADYVLCDERYASVPTAEVRDVLRSLGAHGSRAVFIAEPGDEARPKLGE